jgi:hypothetical protein
LYKDTNHKTGQIYKNKTLNKQNKNNMAGKTQYKGSIRAKTLNPEKHKQADQKM